MALVSKVSLRLDDAQRQALSRLVRTGTHPAAQLPRAHVLLKADTDGPDAWSDTRIGRMLGCSFMTVRRVRQQFVAEGLDATLHRKLPRAASTASSTAARRRSCWRSPVRRPRRAGAAGG